MKKINLLFALLLTATFFVACDKDDDGTSNEFNEANLKGKWFSVSATEDGESFELDECDKMDNVEFLGNNTFKTEVYYTENEDVNADGTVTLNCELDAEDEGTWKILNSESLLITQEGDVDTIKVAAFTGDRITFTFENGEYTETYEKR